MTISYIRRDAVTSPAHQLEAPVQNVDSTAPPGIFADAAHFTRARESVAEARKWITEMFAKWDLEPYDAQSIVTELAANAVVHARTSFRIAVTRTTNDLVRITVSDYSSALPVIPTQGALLDEGGRGLLMVKMLSEYFECRPASGCSGKAIAVDLRGVPIAA